MDNQYKPNYAIPPMETIKETMNAKNISLKELAEISNVEYSTLLKVMSVEREIDNDIAEGLQRALGVPKSFWVNLELNYQETLKRIQ